jgi:hypothetical protein
MDIGLYHVGSYVKTLPTGKVIDASELFTVDDGYNVHVYERPYGAEAVEIRRAIAVAFIDEQNSSLEYRIAGRYPNYHVEEAAIDKATDGQEVN